MTEISNYKGSEKDKQQKEGIYVRAEFEFNFQSEVLAIHVSFLRPDQLQTY